jgi:fructose-1-phosphate kinase PfkB-like protein
MLDDNKGKENGDKNQDIIDLMAQLQDLKLAFDKVKVATTETTAVTEEGSNVTTLKSTTSVKVEPQDFKNLQQVVSKLRTSFIQ